MASNQPSSVLPTPSWEDEIFQDPITAELDYYREQHAAEFDYDLDRMIEDTKSREVLNTTLKHRSLQS
jgi:hypothetical protein